MEKPDIRQMWTSAEHFASHPERYTVPHPTGGFSSDSKLPPTRRFALGGVQVAYVRCLASESVCAWRTSPSVIPEQSGIHDRQFPQNRCLTELKQNPKLILDRSCGTRVDMGARLRGRLQLYRVLIRQLRIVT